MSITPAQLRHFADGYNCYRDLTAANAMSAAADRIEELEAKLADLPEPIGYTVRTTSGAWNTADLKDFFREVNPVKDATTEEA